MSSPFSGSFGDPGSNPYADGGGASRNAVVNLNANTGNYQQQMGQAAASTNSLNQAVGNLLTRIDHLFKSGGRALKIVGAGDIATLSGAVASAGQLQAQMSTLSATAAVNRTSMKAFGRDVDQVFAKFPSHRGDVVALVTELTNLGAKGRDVESLAMTFTKLGAASGENISSLTQSLVLLARQAGVTDSTKIAGFANAVLTASKAAGVGVNNVLQFAQSIEPIARQANIAVPAVLDIATAFTKAGADGFVATNMFNSIVNDITTMTRTGSPELVKYANFIGKTVDQFKRMPAKEQMTGIFDAIAKGGPQALNFLTELGLGTRQLSAVQAVAQSGGLGGTKAATNANDTRNLDRGAHAALNGLDAQWGIVRNQITRFADLIGAPILSPLTGLAKGFGAFLSLINSVVHALGPIPTIVMGIVALLAPLGGLLLGHAGLIMAGATMRMMTNSGVKASFVAGRAAGASGETVAGTKASTAVMPLWRSRTAYGMGASMGRGFGDSGVTPVPLYIGAHRPPGDEAYIGGHRSPLPPPSGMGIGGAARLGMFGAIRGVGGGAAGYFNQQARFLDDSTLTRFTRSAYTTGSISMGQRFGAFGANVRNDAATQTVGRAITAQGAVLVRAIAGVAAGTTKAGMSLAAAGVGKITAPIGRGISGLLPVGVGASLGQAGLGLGRGVATAAGAAFSLPGMMAMMIGLPLITSFMHRQSADQQAHSETDVMANLNPLQKYNDALGIATTNLAQFSVGLKAATPKAGVATDKTTFAQAMVVDKSDLSKYGNTKGTDRNIETMGALNGKNKIAQVKALLASYQISDPKELALFGQNMLASGFTLAETNSVLGSYVGNKPPDFRAGAAAVNAAQGTSRNSKNADALTGANLGAIERTHTDELKTHTPGYADTHRLASELQFVTAQASGAKGAGGMEGLANTLATITGDTKASFMKLLAPGSQAEKPVLDKNGAPLTDVNGKLVDATGRPLRTSAIPGGKDAFDPEKFNKLDALGKQQYILKVMGDSGPGANMLKTMTTTGGVTDPTKMDKFLNDNFGIASASQLSTVKNFGPLGKFVNTDPTVQKAVGDQSADPATQVSATERLVAASKKGTESFGKTADELQRLADSIGGASTTAGATIEAAAAWARQLQGYQQPYQSRAQNVGDAAATATASRKRAFAKGATQEDKDQWFKVDSPAYEQSKASYTQYMLSVLQTTREFGVQQVRAHEDYNLQVFRSQRNFQIQSLYSEQDYVKQRGRTLEDFNIQQTRAAQAAAESIYSPYTRVQSQAVVNGGMLAGNLKDENDRIEKQHRQVAELRKKGLSQSSIDTLRLNDPANAQQTNAIALSVANDPATIKRINTLIAARRKATVALTQSQYNEDFRNTVADFTRGLNRTETDYNTARKRAVDAQALALSDMGTDFNKMVSRSGEDLTRQMTELYGSFASTYADTLASINKNIAQFNPELAASLIAQITSVKAAVDAAAAAGADNSGGGGGGSGAPSGSAQNPIYQAGTMGINEKGQTGTYDASGHFQVQTTRGMPAAYVKSLPHIGNPKSEPHGSPLQIMKATASRFGWGGGVQWDALNNIELNEAGYNPTVANPSSGALGLAQALGHGNNQTAGTLGNEYGGYGLSNAQAKAANSGNAEWQAMWMMNYIKNSYGDPKQAWAQYHHADGRNWYAAGGIFKGPRFIGIGEKGPEAALPLNARGADFMISFYDQVSTRLATRMATRGLGQPGLGLGGERSPQSVHEDHRVYYEGGIHVQADDPAIMERKLADRQRLKRLAQPGSARA